MSEHTPIPSAELELFKFISPDIDVVVDVGARTDIDYKLIKPSLTCHLFEPEPEFFSTLAGKCEGLENMHLNNYGLSDEEGFFHYNDGIQSFRGHNKDDRTMLVRTLDMYIRENNIDKIDFLKMDTEGWDLKVLMGCIDHWSKIKYLQYEHWNDDQRYRKVLGQDFDCEYTGYRNGFAINKALVSQERRDEVIKYIRDNKMGELA